MKIEFFERMVMNRRTWLKGTAAVSSTGVAGSLAAMTTTAHAQDNLRAQILQIPGVGKGSPTDADWQKVGEMCLAATKANVKEGEFKGVPYDGKLTKDDGKGTWWEGYDPQDLYAQNHPLSKGLDWNWTGE